MRYRSVAVCAEAGVLATLLVAVPTASFAQTAPAEQISPGENSPTGFPLEREPKPLSPVSYPHITGAFEIEVQNDNTYRTGNGNGERNVLFTDSTATFSLYFNPEISVQSNLHVEPVRDEFGDRNFKDHGLYLEQLYGLYDGERYQALGGKFNLEFGFAWDKGPGVYGTDFAEDYEFTERLGIGGGFKFGGEDLGNHRISAQLFVADNTPLSYTAFERRFEDTAGRFKHRNRERYPGVANTSYPTSFAVVATGEEMPFLPGTTYNLGFIHESGDDGAKNETGGVFGLEYTYEPQEDLAIVLLGETARFNQYQGSDEDRFYLTAGVGVAYGPWGGSVSGTWRHIALPSGSAPGRFDDLLFQTSAGYTLDLGAAGSASLNVGWKAERVETAWADTVGVLFTYSHEFGTAP